MAYSKIQHISPMLCTLVKDVPQMMITSFEIKWDGFRIVAYVDSATERMKLKEAMDYTKKYALVAEALKGLKLLNSN